ncbi:hypothetical protein ACFL27_26630, partial [candidate division CSSED10-310 bacterium]
MKIRENRYPFTEGWPSDHQEMLVKAAFLQKERATGPWEEWLSKTDFNNLEIYSRSILPLTYQNLLKQGVTFDSWVLEYLRKLY